MLASGWSSAAPYTQTITVDEDVDDLNVDANIVYSGDLSIDDGLNRSASCLSYIKKNGKAIIFYCLKNKPEIDIPVEVTYESVNGIATIEDGVKLNFEVVGGANQPINPKENTIWVQTEDEINDWIFSITEPITLEEGILWFIMHPLSATPFNTIKEGNIQAYPIAARQYINGEWINKTASIYQNNTWIQFSVAKCYLFKAGSGAITSLKTYQESSATITVTDDAISTTASSTTECYATCRTEKVIDLSPYSTMYFTYTASGRKYAEGCKVGVVNKPCTTGDITNTTLATETALSNSSTSKTVSVDLSSINDSLYCCFGFCGKLKVTEWWLE